MKRAKELERNILSMATGGGTSEDGREKNEAKRRSWSDVVSNSPPRSLAKPKEPLAGMPVHGSRDKKGNSVGSPPGRGGSPQKFFSVEDVGKLVELARNQLRREKEEESGWKEVESKEAKHKEKTYARDLVEGYQRSPESQFRCWQCDKPGHKSSECPEGERCFNCNGQGHKWAECPAKRKYSRSEKGKSLDIGHVRKTHQRPMVGIRIGD